VAWYLRRQWSRQELLRRVGSIAQLAGIKALEAADGVERGVRIFQVDTGSGLSFRVLADRALDISACSYKGVPLAWLSPSGEAHPSYYEAQELGWLRTFQGGLVATCGLDQFGAPSTDHGEAFGLHGRVSNVPAQQVSYGAYWEGEEYELDITGNVRQARLFGENLLLERKITTRLGSKRIRIDDTVTNEGFSPQPHMILYHCNLGFPLLDEGARLHLEADETVPRDGVAEAGLHEWRRFQPPTPGYLEQVFRHVAKADNEGMVRVVLENPGLGLSLALSYDKASLPHLFQWKMMGEGAYVLGLEPANSSGIEGRAIARQREDLPYLEPGESRSYWLELEVVDEERDDTGHYVPDQLHHQLE
jgi:galactose mutarotase-like enzyme